MLAALLLAATLVASPQQAPPDVLFVVWDDVSSYDVDEIDTPNLDAMASEGVNFTRAYAHALCAPSRASFFSGQWRSAYYGEICPTAAPIGSPVSTYTFPLTSIASEFLHRGYATATIGKYHMGRILPDLPPELAPNPMGFERWLGGVSSGGGCFAGFVVDDGVLVPKTGQDDLATQLNRTLQAITEARNEGRQFFGVLSTTNAHEKWDWSSFDPESPPFNGSTNRERFESEVRGLDAVIPTLRARMGPDSIIVLIGDNGTPSKVAPDPAKAKKTVFERGVRVPLVITGPWFTPGDCDDMVSIVDLYPTMMAGNGWSSATALDGESLLPCLFGQPLGREHVYVENPLSPESAIIESRWKLRVDKDGNEELYDLDADPLEASPVDSAHPDYIANYPRLKALWDSV